MPFRLGEGEQEEAASFVPLSLTGSRMGKPVRWSLDYLCENAEGGCGKVVGKGNFAKVAVTTHKASGIKMAVKAITTYTEEFGSMDDIIDVELKTLQATSLHPNVVDCLGYVKTSESVYIMMPMIETDLAKLLAKVGPLSEDLTQRFMRQVTSATEFLHSRNILHRDLKPANLLLTEEKHLLLADFGLATIIPPGEAVISGLPCGTKAYMSPEQVEGEGLMLYSPKVDTWGLGVIAFEMLHDTMPFRPVCGAKAGDDMAHMEANSSAAELPALGEVLELKYTNSADIEERANIMSAKYAIDDHLVSTDAKDFISKLLEKDVEKRLSAADAAEHRWLGGPDRAIDTRIKAADAVAAREVELNAEKAARLAKGKRRGARCRVKAAVVQTDQGKGVLSGISEDGGEAKCQA
eukprot:jgi/Undpi1/3135/HiC_scaffold_15.g06509.m1